MRVLGFLVVLLCTIVAFQNCGEWQGAYQGYSTSSSPKTRSSLEGGGNGSGYSGIMKLISPAHTQENETFIVKVIGGKGPYTFTTNQGLLTVESLGKETFEIFNQTEGNVQSYILEVRDSLGNVDRQVIQIVQGDSLFNYSYAITADHLAGVSAILDRYLKLVLVFDAAGNRLKTIGPEGYRLKSFEENSQLKFRPNGDLLVLEKDARRIHIYDRASGFSFETLIDLSENPNLISPSGMKVEESLVYIIDRAASQVYTYDFTGSFTGSLDEIPSRLPDGTVVEDFVFLGNGDLILADSGNKQLLQVRDGEVFKAISEVPLVGGDGVYSFLGPSRLQLGDQGQVFLLDEYFNTTTHNEATDGHYRGQQKILRLNHLFFEASPEATVLQDKRTSNWHNPTDCFSFKNATLSLCTSQRYMVLTDEFGEQIGNMSPLVSNNFLKKMHHLAVREDGGFFVSYNLQYIASYNSERKLVATAGGWGREGDQNLGVSDLLVVGDQLWVASSKLKGIKVLDSSSLSYIKTIFLQSSNGLDFSPSRLGLQNDEVVIQGLHDELLVYSRSGHFLRSIQLAMDSSGSKFDLKRARGMVVNKDNIHLLDFNALNVWSFSFSGQVRKKISLENKVYNLAFVQSGNLAAILGNTAYVIDPESGNEIGTIGISGTEPGAFNGLYDLDSLDGKLYMLDHFNNRVQILTFPNFLK